MAEYKVESVDQFKTLARRYPNTAMEKVVGETELIYNIEGDELISDGLELGFITEYTGHGGIQTLRTPEDLREIITSVEREDFGEETVFKIITERGEIRVKGEDMFKLSTYKHQLLLKCKIALAFSLKGKGKSGEFDEFLSWLVDTAVETWKSDETEDEIMREMIMAELRTLPIITDWQDMVSEYTTMDEDGVYKIRGSCVMGVAKGVIGNISFVRLQSILRESLASPSTQIMVKGVRMTVWNFSTSGWKI